MGVEQVCERLDREDAGQGTYNREYTSGVNKTYTWLASAEKVEPGSFFSADESCPYVFSVVIYVNVHAYVSNESSLNWASLPSYMNTSEYHQIWVRSFPV